MRAWLLIFCMAGGCGVQPEPAQTRAIDDGQSVLGVRINDNGLYSLLLCRKRATYSAREFADPTVCQPALLEADGQVALFSPATSKMSLRERFGNLAKVAAVVVSLPVLVWAGRGAGRKLIAAFAEKAAQQKNLQVKAKVDKHSAKAQAEIAEQKKTLAEVAEQEKSLQAEAEKIKTAKSNITEEIKDSKAKLQAKEQARDERTKQLDEEVAKIEEEYGPKETGAAEDLATAKKDLETAEDRLAARRAAWLERDAELRAVIRENMEAHKMSLDEQRAEVLARLRSTDADIQIDAATRDALRLTSAEAEEAVAEAKDTLADWKRRKLLEFKGASNAEEIVARGEEIVSDWWHYQEKLKFLKELRYGTQFEREVWDKSLHTPATEVYRDMSTYYQVFPRDKGLFANLAKLPERRPIFLARFKTYWKHGSPAQKKLYAQGLSTFRQLHLDHERLKLLEEANLDLGKAITATEKQLADAKELFWQKEWQLADDAEVASGLADGIRDLSALQSSIRDIEDELANIQPLRDSLVEKYVPEVPERQAVVDAEHAYAEAESLLKQAKAKLAENLASVSKIEQEKSAKLSVYAYGNDGERRELESEVWYLKQWDIPPKEKRLNETTTDFKSIDNDIKQMRLDREESQKALDDLRETTAQATASMRTRGENTVHSLRAEKRQVIDTGMLSQEKDLLWSAGTFGGAGIFAYVGNYVLGGERLHKHWAKIFTPDATFSELQRVHSVPRLLQSLAKVRGLKINPDALTLLQ